jgi:putative endonuclease
MKTYYVYIMTNRSGTLYTGVTNDPERRVYEHKSGIGSKLTTRYRIDRLVHFETFSHILDAIAREKQIKGWLREKKIALIESANPNWEDLSEAWYEAMEGPAPDDSSAAEVCRRR